MTDLVWLFIAYVAGTLFTLFILGPQIATRSIEATIDSLMAKGIIRYKKDKDGEIEILKWNDNQN